MPSKKPRTNGTTLVESAAREWRGERADVLATALAMARSGLVVGTSGNVSLRLADPEGRRLMAITPSSQPYEAMTVKDIAVIDFEGEPVVGETIPSTETLTHAAIYEARPDVGAVMHTHSTYATAMAVAGLEIPAIIDEMVMALGGAIHVTEYSFPGSEALAAQAVAALGERKAVLIRNHGLVGVGCSLEEALRVCQLTEHVAQVYTIARLMGRSRGLPPNVVAAEVELYRMRRDAEVPP